MVSEDGPRGLEHDPFVLTPSFWFGVLCEGLSSDNQGRVTLQNIVSQFRFRTPPEATGVPSHAFVQAHLAVGFIGGLGEFTTTIQLFSPDDEVIWQPPEPWRFTMSGGVNSAVFVAGIEQWLAEPGTYRFTVQLQGHSEVWTIPLEVADQIGPQSQ